MWHLFDDWVGGSVKFRLWLIHYMQQVAMIEEFPMLEWLEFHGLKTGLSSAKRTASSHM